MGDKSKVLHVLPPWRGEAEEAADQEEALPQGPADPEAEDEAADQQEDADGEGRRRGSVRPCCCFFVKRVDVTPPGGSVISHVKPFENLPFPVF